MSFIKKESIKAIASTLGIDKLDDKICLSLAQDVEYRLRQLVEDGSKFMRQSHRQTMRTDDIDSALRLRNVDSLYGYSSSDPITFRRMTQNGDELFFPEDVIVMFDDIIQEPLPQPPADPTFSVHWLAVEGEQPQCPQNPPPISEKHNVANDTNRKRKAAFKNVIVDSKKIKSLEVIEHTLSKEQQLYYTYVTDAIKSDDLALKKLALTSLSEDAGLHQLLPYFTKFIAEEVASNLTDLPILSSLMQMAYCLVTSDKLHIEPYLHQLMPSILTCLLGKRLCKDLVSENHWNLRDFSAKLVSIICKRFGHAYDELQPRISKTLALTFLDPNKPLTTHYGAIQGLASMGHYVVKLVILPNLELYMKLLETSLSDDNMGRKMEANYCYGALLRAVGRFIQNELAVLRTLELNETTIIEKSKNSGKKKRRKKDIKPLALDFPGAPLPVRMDTLSEIFGDKLVPFTTYATIHPMKHQEDSFKWSLPHIFI